MVTVRITVIGLQFIDHIPVMACMVGMGQGPTVTGRMGEGIAPVVDMAGAE